MTDVSFFFSGWEPILRILVVGTLGYIALAVLMRAGNKRTLAQLTAFDFIITVAIGAAFGGTLTARSVSLLEAATAFALLVALQVVVTWIQVRYPAFGRAVAASPTMLYFRGRFLDDALRTERLTKGEVIAVARQHGHGSLDGVEAIVLEANGTFAVIRKGVELDRSMLEHVR